MSMYRMAAELYICYMTDVSFSLQKNCRCYIIIISFMSTVPLKENE